MTRPASYFFLVDSRLSHLLTWILIVSSNAFATPSTSQASSTQISATTKPVLVIGATGRVGRLVVEQLLAENRPVRAVIRNTTKAKEIFGENSTSSLDFVEADLGYYDTSKVEDALDKAVEGCDSIISVSGTLRFSKLTDFLPWRLFRMDVSSWCDNDRSHPYFTNYQAQKLLVDLAAKHKISRFVRLTGLSVGLPAFSLISVLFSGLLSMSSRYNFLMEQYLRESSVPHVILRPGGLTSKERNPATTSLQVDPSGLLPPPARVGRSDVASLAIAACDLTILPIEKSYTLAVRWVGQVAPKAQGAKEDGRDSARDCLKQVASSTVKFQTPKHNVKPYGAAVALFFYSFAAISFKVSSLIFRMVKSALFRL